MKDKTETKFEKDCKRVAEDTSIDVMFVEDDRPARCFEDDGTLHIIRRGVRACFNVSYGQSASAVIQNANTRMVLSKLRIKASDSVFEDETVDEDEDGYCSHCGRGTP